MIFVAGMLLILVILFCIFIPFTNFIFRKILSKKSYKKYLELIFTCVGILSYPGFAGCASGFIGVGIPVPLIIGFPAHLLFISEKNCGWLPFITLEGAPEFKALTILSIPIYLLIVFVFYLKAKRN
jgi:hypothetical protein